MLSKPPIAYTRRVGTGRGRPVGGRGSDPIAIVEAAYDLDVGLQGWLEGLAGAVRPDLDSGYGTQAVLYHASNPNVRPRALAVSGTPPGMEKYLMEINDRAPPGGAAAMMGSPSRLYSYRELSAPIGQQDFFDDHPLGDLPPFQDWLAVLVSEPGLGLLVGGMSPVRISVPPVMRSRWHKLSAHIGAGLRLQLRLTAEQPLAPDAVLEPDGRFAHAEGEAKSHSAREVLREAARQLDRARGPMRREDGDGALELWRGLVDGRWSLLDRFESDGRRYVVAVRNEPPFRDPRGLTPRQRHVAHLVSMGHSNKEVAYALGLSASAVSTHVSAVLRRLGLRRREQLVAALSPGPARTTKSRMGNAVVGVASTPVAVPGADHGLTEAEREVVAGVVRGLSDREIAAERGVAPRTVANQLRSVFRKVGVRSRSELVGVIQRTPTTGGACT